MQLSFEQTAMFIPKVQFSNTWVSFLQDPVSLNPQWKTVRSTSQPLQGEKKKAYLVKIEGVDVRGQGLCDVMVVVVVVVVVDVVCCVGEADSGKVVSCCCCAAGEHDCFGSVSFAPGAV